MLVGRGTGPLGHSLEQDALGFSLNPLHYVKKAAVATEHGVVKGGKFVAHHAVDVAKLAALPVIVLNKAILQPILHVALTPVRHKVNTLKNRRAKKLAWDHRKSTTPTPQENAEAKSWAKGYLKKEVPPFGLMLSLLAGPPAAPIFYGHSNGLGDFGDPTTATIVASVPTLLAIIDKILTRSSKNGEAPASSGGAAAGDGAATDAAAPADAGAGGGDASAAAAADDASSDGSGGGGGGGKHKGHGGGDMKLPGVGAIPKKALYIGGGVLGLLLIVALVKKS